MKYHLQSAVVLLAKTLGVAAAALLGNAWAGPADPSVTATLESINTQVTYRRPAAKQEQELVTYAAYRLTIWNKTTNALNRVYLNAEAINVNGSDPVLFDSLADIAADAYTCSGFDTSTLNCTTSLSIPPGGEATFVVVARAPLNGEKIRIVWYAGGHEGNGQGNGCCAVPGTNENTALIDPTNGSFNENAQSFIKNTGGKLFTGDRWITKTNDPITTLVEIPGFNTARFVENGQIAEKENTDQAVTCNVQGHFNKCYKSTVTLIGINFDPDGAGGLFPTDFLKIVLRLDSSIIKKGTRIEDVSVNYEDETEIKEFGLCIDSSPETYPCIVDRRVIRNQNSVENYTTDLKDDFQWTIKHYKNGSYTFF